ncbi:MAG: hypothetical protein M3O95_11425 [Candidatus Dormibacteraeota bacterium]|nr:hypothetical protein [Candidatus Dormibacteraeota bacterium]
MSSQKQPSSEEALEEASRRLYSERPEDFVAARGRLVRELRGQGERELAGRVAALRRPTLSLWLANRLSEVAAPELEELLAVGGELQDAQAKAARGDAGARRRFRELIARHSQLIEALVRAAQSYAAENGHGGGDEVGRRLAATLRAASTEPGESGRRLAQGSLPAEVEPGGFELISAGTREGRAEAGERGEGRKEAATGEESFRAGEEASGVEGAARAAEARKLAAERERAAVAARSRADELARRARSLLREAARAQEEADAAESEAAAAQNEAAQARQAADEAAARAKRR